VTGVVGFITEDSTMLVGTYRVTSEEVTSLLEEMNDVVPE
jgi:hypothetical protein